MRLSRYCGLVLLSVLVSVCVTAAAAGSGRALTDSQARLAFARGVSPDRYEIWTASGRGQGLRRVTHGCGWDWWPAWSPDRTQLAFARSCGSRFAIYIVNANGGGLHRLVKTSSDDVWPSWSPDGSEVAFVAGSTGRTELYVIGANGKGLHRLTHNGVDDASPAWSPDGSLILFSSGRTHHRLTTIPAEGGTPHALPLRGGEPAWSPDGTRIVWAKGIAGAARETADLWIANADGSGARRLTHEQVGVVSHHPSWSPDGRTIAYMSNRGAPSKGAALWTISPTGGTPHRITSPGYEDADPTWQPAASG